ncbi:hypothetical protein ACQEUU_37040 [Nonomuraea sp. CA-218870]|uniref:hypothetical protein n=1 Tax=Nonomuraea sp. CA-218870 TaxID=3239998 RepID=UPI003D92BFFC
MTDQTAIALVCCAAILIVVAGGAALWISELKDTIRRLRADKADLMETATSLQADNSRLAVELDQAKRSGTTALLHERMGDRP